MANNCVALGIARLGVLDRYALEFKTRFWAVRTVGILQRRRASDADRGLGHRSFDGRRLSRMPFNHGLLFPYAASEFSDQGKRHLPRVLDSGI